MNEFGFITTDEELTLKLGLALEDERIKTRLEIEKYIKGVESRTDKQIEESLAVLHAEIKSEIRMAIAAHTAQAVWISLVAGFWLVVILVFFL